MMHTNRFRSDLANAKNAVSKFINKTTRLIDLEWMRAVPVHPPKPTARISRLQLPKRDIHS